MILAHGHVYGEEHYFYNSCKRTQPIVGNAIPCTSGFEPVRQLAEHKSIKPGRKQHPPWFLIHFFSCETSSLVMELQKGLISYFLSSCLNSPQ